MLCQCFFHYTLHLQPGKSPGPPRRLAADTLLPLIDILADSGMVDVVLDSKLPGRDLRVLEVVSQYGSSLLLVCVFHGSAWRHLVLF